MSYESESNRRRKIPVSQTDATTAFTRRYDADLAAARNGTPDDLTAFKANLLDRIAHPVNLHRALQHLRRRGGVAQGRDRLAVHDLDRDEGFQLCEALSELILSGQYRRSVPRLRKIPKPPPKMGTRTIAVFKVADRVAARGTSQIVDPLLDPLMDNCSYGFRPRRGRMLALAEAQRLTMTEGRHVWVLSDVKKAFDRIPKQRLLQLLSTELPYKVVQLLVSLTDTARKRGIPQGLAVSPLCLNFYLHHCLDKRWRKLHPDWPLIRYADDIAILCRSLQEALEARQALDRQMIDISLPLKPPNDETIVDLQAGQQASWLGYDVHSASSGDIAISIGKAAWDRLDAKLQEIRDKKIKASSDMVRRGMYLQLLAGWTIQRGPSKDLTDPKVLQRKLQGRVKLATGQPIRVSFSNIRSWCARAQSQWEHAKRTVLSENKCLTRSAQRQDG